MILRKDQDGFVEMRVHDTLVGVRPAISLPSLPFMLNQRSRPAFEEKNTKTNFDKTRRNGGSVCTHARALYKEKERRSESVKN